jgi:predicted DNA-binding protein (UPF0251 family)
MNFNGDIQDALDDFNNDADAAVEDLNNAIDDATTKLEDTIGPAFDEVIGGGGVIPDISDDFLELFWEALEEIYTYVDPYERRQLIHKALLKKDEFLMRLDDFANSQEGEMKTCREVMNEVFDECRTKLADAIANERVWLQDGVEEDLCDKADEATQRLADELENKMTGADDGSFE